MDVSGYVNQLCFGYYPYFALLVFFVGSLIRSEERRVGKECRL